MCRVKQSHIIRQHTQVHLYKPKISLYVEDTIFRIMHWYICNICI